MENTQYVRVQKNGQEGRLHITTWERIGKENNKDGWIKISEEPQEVIEIREKKISQQIQEQNYKSESVIAVKDEDVVKEKRKTKKK